MRFTDKQINQPTLDDENELVADLIVHLGEIAPQILTAYPPGYFIMLIRSTVRIAQRHFKLDDLEAIRLFAFLRWEIAAGYYYHPTIKEILLRTDLEPMERFERLQEPDLEHVWLESAVYDGPDYWRGEKRGAPDMPPEEYEDE